MVALALVDLGADVGETLAIALESKDVDPWLDGQRSPVDRSGQRATIHRGTHVASGCAGRGPCDQSNRRKEDLHVLEPRRAVRYERRGTRLDADRELGLRGGQMLLALQALRGFVRGFAASLVGLCLACPRSRRR